MLCVLSYCKYIFKNRIYFLILTILIIVAVSDPIFSYKQYIEELGDNAYQYWMLMGMVGYGGTFFRTLFRYTPVFSTGLLYLMHLYSSMGEFNVIRIGRRAYYISVYCATIVCSAVLVGIPLMLNLIIVNVLFNDESKIVLDWILPRKGTYCYTLYAGSPLRAEIFYTIVTVLAFVLLACFATGIWHSVRFPNKYVAIAAPIILYYIIGYVTQVSQLLQYDLGIILQPISAMGIEATITKECFYIVFAFWGGVDLLLLILGIYRQKDIIKWA